MKTSQLDVRADDILQRYNPARFLPPVYCLQLQGVTQISGPPGQGC